MGRHRGLLAQPALLLTPTEQSRAEDLPKLVELLTRLFSSEQGLLLRHAEIRADGSWDIWERLNPNTSIQEDERALSGYPFCRR